MRGVRPEDRVLLVGQTGMGKTTLARYLVEGLQPIRTIIVDPKGELRFGVAPARSVEELRAALPRPLTHWIPARLDRDTIEQGFWAIQNTPGPLLVLIDEAAAVSSDSWVPEGAKLLVTQGRQGQRCVIACTQRLAECHPVFRSQAEHIIAMVPAPIELDLRMLAGQVGREAKELRRMLDELEQTRGLYSHLWYVRPGNEMRHCAPLPAPPSHPTPPPATPPPGAPPAASTAPTEPVVE